jgi:hypothetical protein
MIKKSNNSTDMEFKKPGFWASLIAVLRPLPPPLQHGICIGFVNEEEPEDDTPEEDES